MSADDLAVLAPLGAAPAEGDGGFGHRTGLIVYNPNGPLAFTSGALIDTMR
ncbi:MAG: hypothetical protein ACRDUS_11315 [Mycobacterium sp.]